MFLKFSNNIGFRASLVDEVRNDLIVDGYSETSMLEAVAELRRNAQNLKSQLDSIPRSFLTQAGKELVDDKIIINSLVMFR